MRAMFLQRVLAISYEIYRESEKGEEKRRKKLRCFYIINVL